MKDFVDESSVMYWRGSPGPGDNVPPDALTGTHLGGPTNSTRFTNCCGLAVNDQQQKCPRCFRTVER